jgi:hypothetical protein
MGVYTPQEDSNDDLPRNKNTTNDIRPMGHFTFNAPTRILCPIKKSHSTLKLTLGMSSKNCIAATIPRVHVVVNLGFRKDSKIDAHLMHGSESHIQIAISSTANIQSNKP